VRTPDGRLAVNGFPVRCKVHKSLSTHCSEDQPREHNPVAYPRNTLP
jgi:hypothetical protein